MALPETPWARKLKRRQDATDSVSIEVRSLAGEELIYRQLFPRQHVVHRITAKLAELRPGLNVKIMDQGIVLHEDDHIPQDIALWNAVFEVPDALPSNPPPLASLNLPHPGSLNIISCPSWDWERQGCEYQCSETDGTRKWVKPRACPRCSQPMTTWANGVSGVTMFKPDGAEQSPREVRSRVKTDRIANPGGKSGSRM